MYWSRKYRYRVKWAYSKCVLFAFWLHCYTNFSWSFSEWSATPSENEWQVCDDKINKMHILECTSQTQLEIILKHTLLKLHDGLEPSIGTHLDIVLAWSTFYPNLLLLPSINKAFFFLFGDSSSRKNCLLFRNEWSLHRSFYNWFISVLFE